jgi:pSer/pThr/pTyr-binding forkhead associated (FHA) protein
MEVKFVLEKNGKRKQVFHLSSNEMVIGRQLGSGLRIPSSAVSRVHCRITREPGYITVEDCASANGTLINGQLIDGRTVLYPGDRLRVGPITLIVEYHMTQATLDRLQEEAEGSAAVMSPDEVEELEVSEVSEESDVEVVAVEEEEEELEVAPVDTDQAEPWDLPAPDDLRDILSQLEDSES